MLRAVIWLLFLMFCNAATAAVVEWHEVRILLSGHYNFDASWGFSAGARFDDGGVVGLNSPLLGNVEGNNLYMVHNDFSLESMNPTFSRWALAFFGEIIGADNFDEATRITPYYTGTSYTGGTLIENPEDFYMVFEMTEVLIGAEDYERGRSLYGWVHVSIDDDLTMTLLGQGVNLDGGSVVVGAIPEPSGGTLLLLGTMLVMLKRNKTAHSSNETIPAPSDHRGTS